jgi:hypothetical protein
MPPGIFDSFSSMQARDQIAGCGSCGLDLRILCLSRDPGKIYPRRCQESGGFRVAVVVLSHRARRGGLGYAGDCGRESPKNGLICAANSYYLACGDHTSIRKKIHIPAAPQCGDLCAKTEGNK